MTARVVDHIVGGMNASEPPGTTRRAPEWRHRISPAWRDPAEPWVGLVWPALAGTVAASLAPLLLGRRCGGEDRGISAYIPTDGDLLRWTV